MAVKAHVMKKLTLFDRVWSESGGPMIMLADEIGELPSFAELWRGTLRKCCESIEEKLKKVRQQNRKNIGIPSTRGTSIRRMCIYWRTGHMLHSLVLKDVPEIVFSSCAALGIRKPPEDEENFHRGLRDPSWHG